jgi:protein involved in polysaccharide export with SLBB domain
LVLVAGCHFPFAKTGPQFNASQLGVQSGSATNFAGVAVTNQLNPELLRPPLEPFTLGPGDRIELEIMGDPASRSLVVVGPDGKIYYYLLPGLDVWGLTLNQAKQRLESELQAYIAGAQVAITLRGIESKRVWLLGRLHNSGVYPAGEPITLLEAISLAGGVLNVSGPGLAGGEQLADLHRSFVVRQGQLLPVDFERLIAGGDMSQNIYLRPDDFVYVPSAAAQDIYVLGAVRQPKAVSFAQATTLIAAITEAGGTIKDAYLSHIGIVRGSVTRPRIAVVSYRDIVAGRTVDVRLEPQDIVYVPFSPYRNLIKYVDLILTTFVRAEAINEGARAAGATSLPVGISIGTTLH